MGKFKNEKGDNVLLMYGSEEINDALNVAAITTLLDTYVDKDGTVLPALFDDMVIPADIAEEAKTINFYKSATADLCQPVEIYTYTINCRAKLKEEAETILKAVADEINRNNYSGYFITCQALPTVPPQNEQDNYNAILEIRIKMK